MTSVGEWIYQPHYHKCVGCGNVWAHTWVEAQRDPRSHVCSVCGMVQVLIHTPEPGEPKPGEIAEQPKPENA